MIERFTCRFGLHVTREFATDSVVVGADVVEAPISHLMRTVELMGTIT